MLAVCGYYLEGVRPREDCWQNQRLRPGQAAIREYLCRLLQLQKGGLVSSWVDEFDFEDLFGVKREYFVVDLEVDVGELEGRHANKINTIELVDSDID